MNSWEQSTVKTFKQKFLLYTVLGNRIHLFSSEFSSWNALLTIWYHAGKEKCKLHLSFAWYGGQGSDSYIHIQKRIDSFQLWWKLCASQTVTYIHRGKILYELFLYAVYFHVIYWFTYMQKKNLQTFLLKKTIPDQTIWDVRSFICVHATSNAHDSIFYCILGGLEASMPSLVPDANIQKINGVRIVAHWQWIGALCMENGWDLYYNQL